MTYQGSEIFKFLSDSSGIRLDQINFLLAEAFAIVIGIAYRHYLPPCPKNTLKRHIVAILAGFLVGNFFYGKQMWHLFCQAFVCFLALKFFPRKYIHLFCFVFCMGYLSGLHLCRVLYDYGNYTLDITTQMMILTQKLTSLGFAYYDGSVAEEKLNADQKNQRIVKRPHIIEFLSYCFNFHGIVVGPLSYYQDYIYFVNGNNILKKQKKNADESESSIIVQPPIAMILLKKAISVLILLVIWFKIAVVYPITSYMEPEILEKPLWYRFFYFQMSAGSQRTKFYIAWVLGDLVNNSCGFGFNGYDSHGNAKWDLVTNINVIAVEKSTSLKTVFDNWNIQTQLWLRRICYDRLHTGKTLGVFVLSAFWHGFYPGYYFCFLLCAFMVYAARGIRRKIRPFFQTSTVFRHFYDFITWLVTMFACNYAASSFDLLEIEADVKFYNTWYWCLHIASVLICLVLPGGSSKNKNHSRHGKKTENVPIDSSETAPKSEQDKKAE